MAQVQAGLGRGEHQDRARVERLLAHYPALSERELAEVTHWFEREASALDVALVASNEEIREGYRRFRAEQVDPLTLADCARAAAVTALAVALIGALLWMGG